MIECFTDQIFFGPQSSRVTHSNSDCNRVFPFSNARFENFYEIRLTTRNTLRIMMLWHRVARRAYDFESRPTCGVDFIHASKYYFIRWNPILFEHGAKRTFTDELVYILLSRHFVRRFRRLFHVKRCHTLLLLLLFSRSVRRVYARVFLSRRTATQQQNNGGVPFE